MSDVDLAASWLCNVLKSCTAPLPLLLRSLKRGRSLLPMNMDEGDCPRCSPYPAAPVLLRSNWPQLLLQSLQKLRLELHSQWFRTTLVPLCGDGVTEKLQLPRTANPITTNEMKSAARELAAAHQIKASVIRRVRKVLVENTKQNKLSARCCVVYQWHRELLKMTVGARQML